MDLSSLILFAQESQITAFFTFVKMHWQFCLLHFLEFAIWGAWIVVLGNMLNARGFSRKEIGRIYGYFVQNHSEQILRDVGLDPRSVDIDLDGFRRSLGLADDVEAVTHRDCRIARMVRELEQLRLRRPAARSAATTTTATRRGFRGRLGKPAA